MKTAKKLTESGTEALLDILQTRFENNMHRHKNLKWDEVLVRLNANPGNLYSLDMMEETGGEPDVIGLDEKTGDYLFYDCAAESPAGRRSLCYDRKALDSRKANKPQNTVIDLADEMGIELLTEEQYRKMQEIENFDLKTSSWIKTPDDIRKLGGALFCDRRYNQVFTYHNGADSYYAARGFRGLLKV